MRGEGQPSWHLRGLQPLRGTARARGGAATETPAVLAVPAETLLQEPLGPGHAVRPEETPDKFPFKEKPLFFDGQ